jgi:hypothetical protein
VAVSGRSHDDFPLADLYAVEREAGSAVQTNLVVIWVAATTYLIAAGGGLSVLADNARQGDPLVNAVWSILYFVPFPACALAGYHLILFGTGVVRSKSIQMVEAELKRRANAISPNSAETKFDWEKFGSMTETEWNDLGKGPAAMLPVSIGAFLVPYFSAILLVGSCYYMLAQHVTNFSWSFTVFFVVSLWAYGTFGVFIVWLAVSTFRKQGDST